MIGVWICRSVTWSITWNIPGQWLGLMRVGQIRQNGDFGRLGLRQAGKLAQFQRLDWKTEPVVTDRSGADAALVGDQFGDGQAAEAALARSHAGSEKNLHLVGAHGSGVHGCPNLACGNFLATAYNRVGIGRNPEGSG